MSSMSMPRDSGGSGVQSLMITEVLGLNPPLSVKNPLLYMISLSCTTINDVNRLRA